MKLLKYGIYFSIPFESWQWLKNQGHTLDLRKFIMYIFPVLRSFHFVYISHLVYRITYSLLDCMTVESVKSLLLINHVVWQQLYFIF